MSLRTLACSGLLLAGLAQGAQAAPMDFLYLFDFETSLTSHAGSGGGAAVNTAPAFVTLDGVTAKNGANSARFDGNQTHDGISVAEDVSEGTMPAMTWGAWVLSDGTGGGLQGILSADSGGFDRLIGLDTRGGQVPGVSMAVFTGAGVVQVAPRPLSWTHFAAAYDGTTIQVYVNGAPIAPIGEVWSAGTTMLTSFNIGANAVFNEEFSGNLDDVFLFDRTLSATEVASIYTDGFGPPARVPVPAALPLLCGALGGLALLGRRRRA